MKFVDPARAKTLPSFPDNAKLTIPTSPAYWGPMQTQLIERFNQWMIS
jgi:putative spermidine/putrescine transport system substrate-binding protein